MSQISLRAPKEPPAACRSIIDVTWHTEEAPSIGLAPLLLQAIQNNYTRGVTSIHFSLWKDQFFMDWKESDEAHRIAIGWDIPAISNIRIHGEPYRIASQGTWTYDEDHRLVLKLKIVFQDNKKRKRLS